MSVLKKLLTSILMAAAISVASSDEFPRVYADVFNWMPPGLQMNAWCKSSGDDIGSRSVATHASYSWNFYPSFAGTTVYSCVVSGEYGRVGFNAYDFKRDNKNGRCVTECKWNATSDGVRGFNERTRSYDIFYRWGK